MNATAQYVSWFRHSSPYINAHRGRTFVLMLEGDAVAHPNFSNIVSDIALLNSLGVRLVLVYGARPQIDRQLAHAGLTTPMHRNLRVTDTAALECVKAAVGAVRVEIEARLSMGLPNSPMHGAAIRVVSGNLVTAKPVGVRDGVDFCHTGEVRRVDCAAIHRQLDDGAIVLIPPLGYSPTGEPFNLALEDVATRTAIELNADKLIIWGRSTGIPDTDGGLLRDLALSAAEARYEALEPASEDARHLRAACRVCRAGVHRVHLISYEQDGALLQELFTRDGAGTLISQESYEQVRDATIDDVGGILELIQPLEEQGILVRRSRELLENEIEQFTVVELDGAIIGCAALYTFDEGQIAELACMVVDPAYRRGQRGDIILRHIEQRARSLGVERLFVLTTHTAHWFRERGFEPAGVEALPKQRQSLYNWQRNSKVFIKSLRRD